MLGVVKCCWQLIWVCVLTLRDVGDHVRGLPGLVKTWSCEGDLTLGPQRYCVLGLAPSLWRGLAAFVFHSVVAALSMGTPIGSEPSDCRGGKEGRDAEACPPGRPPKSLRRTVCINSVRMLLMKASHHFMPSPFMRASLAVNPYL